MLQGFAKQQDQGTSERNILESLFLVVTVSKLHISLIIILL